MPDIIKQVPTGNAGQKARGVVRDYLQTTYGVALLFAGYLTTRFVERKARDTAAKHTSAVSVSAPATASNDPFPGAI